VIIFLYARRSTLSAHADVDDLSRWIGNFSNSPAVHVVHGEAQSKQDFRDHLEGDLGFKADVPEMGEVLEL
jgi:metallo-beta-lactamase family protein